MTFTPEGIVLIVMALGVVIVNIINAVRQNRKLESIEGHVNGATSVNLAEIKALRTEIATLLESRGERKQEAALLAQAAATTVSSQLER